MPGTQRLVRHRGQALLEILLALAVMGLGIAGCMRLLLYSVASQSLAGERERLAWRIADAGELIQAWPEAPASARVAEWQQQALTPAPAAAARAGDASLEPSADAPPSVRRWRARITWRGNATASAATGFSAFRHGLAPPP